MTAVEWFAKQVLRSRQLGFISNEKFNELLEQAKEMEKEQIMDFAMKFMMQDRPIVSFYNETYKSKQDEE